MLDRIHHLHAIPHTTEDGIRDLVRSRGLGDVYKRQLEIARTGKVALERASGVNTEMLKVSPSQSRVPA